MNKQILLLALAPEYFYRSPLLEGYDQFFCGPDASNTINNPTTKVLRLNLQNMDGYEIRAILRYKGWNPDLVFVKADATRRNHIRKMDELPGKKILLMGDTHHMKSPIQSMIAYAKSEKWDLITSEHDRHHLPLFAESGIDRLIWLPCFTMNPYKVEPNRATDPRPVFVGSLSPHHKYRINLLNRLQEKGIKIHVTTVDQARAAEHYNKHAISLNVSLNGDLNFRIMEVLAAGGCLLTDRLGPDSGLDLLLTDGVHYLSYRTADEAAEKISWLQANPERRMAIAHAGFSRFWNTFSPVQQSEALHAALNAEPIPELFTVPR